MRRVLLLLVGAAVLTLPAAAAARAGSHSAPGFLVVRNASTDGGVTGSPVVTVVVQGFVLGHVAQEGVGVVDLYHINSPVAAQAAGIDISRRAVKWHGVPGTEFSGSDFRFRAVGGYWRVVAYGAGVSLYAGGEGSVSLHGSSAYPDADGEYSLDGGRFVSFPSGVVSMTIGAK